MPRQMMLVTLFGLCWMAGGTGRALHAEEPPAQADAPEPEPVEMTVHGIAIDPTDKVPVVILATQDKSMLLPIQIGPAEAAAIWRYLNDVEAPRPMTHDLLASVITKLGGTIEKITITDLKDGVFYAQIDLGVGNGVEARTIRIDARPSDSIALALRAGSKLFVVKKVIDAAGRKPDDGDQPDGDEPEPERGRRRPNDEAI